MMKEVQESAQSSTPVGFIGLGVMGQPMALNLLRAGIPLVVWNRSAERTTPLAVAGARVAPDIDALLGQVELAIVMLVNSAAIDEVLGRNTSAFAPRVAGRTIVCMSSVAPEYARDLCADIEAAGGRYVECPVSGSRKPAEAGQLVGLIGGQVEDVERVQNTIAPMCRKIVACGGAGDALLIKLSINLYLNTMLAGLAEAVHFAEKHGLDLAVLQAAIDAGPMACDVTRVKLPKLVADDFSVQAASSDAWASCQLIAQAARTKSIASPLLSLSQALYGETVAQGNGRNDMVSVIEAIRRRSDALG
ncbi:NAD(P)-dependent oxidoreductase [Achromobacter deleyi]|uniref:NAD(P)-dependent oxidoreductase n=1 Tax=Achromobacter deleyi TaxID=1353891 RepID=UPI0014651178|nr:NAD(P)-dependent oxidoreductase [Achromobacter deleyi]CAB3837448.1 2-hydroxy-3-oxopropionate reductase [Achromobacter deleyi]